EIAIKVSTGKLTLRQPLAELNAELRSTGMIHVLPIADAHLVGVSALPFHHRDPFDRLLIAQALADGMAVVGNDGAFDDYGVTRVW
ncbi:MAG: type II toxin-antitoxin system VapC family toxin, partial [Chthoniobacteraceae bacterium]